jgi:hypothetical protein
LYTKAKREKVNATKERREKLWKKGECGENSRGEHCENSNRAFRAETSLSPFKMWGEFVFCFLHLQGKSFDIFGFSFQAMDVGHLTKVITFGAQCEEECMESEVGEIISLSANRVHVVAFFGDTCSEKGAYVINKIVRRSVFGPYAAQSVSISPFLSLPRTTTLT